MQQATPVDVYDQPVLPSIDTLPGTMATTLITSHLTSPPLPPTLTSDMQSVQLQLQEVKLVIRLS